MGTAVTAGTLLTLGQLYAVQELVYTRPEAMAQLKRMDTFEADSKTLRKDLYHELQNLNIKLARIEGRLRNYLREKDEYSSILKENKNLITR